MPNKLGHITFSPETSIHDVIVGMSANNTRLTGVPSGIALIVDVHGRLSGIATDGDIRKGLSRGIQLTDTIEKVMNADPFVVPQALTPKQMLITITNRIKEKRWHKMHIEKVVVVNDQHAPINIVSTYALLQASDVRFKHIGIVGLGYVGLTLGLTLADLDFTVKAYDVNPNVVESLQSEMPHFYEEGLKKLLSDQLNKNFHPVADFSGVNNCEVYILTVGTPLNEMGEPDVRSVKDASTFIGKFLKYGDLVILRSTVPIGTMRSLVIPALESASDLSAEKDFFVVFAPERTIEGNALIELRKQPQIIGGYNRHSSELAGNIFGAVTNSIVHVDSLEDAEMVKLINNSYRDVTFAFANEIALIAKEWGIGAKKVIDAANFNYGRSQVPQPSPGVGGSCLEKDSHILFYSAKKKNYTPELIHYARLLNNKMILRLTNDIGSFIRRLQKKPTDVAVTILGFAFKGRPTTSDVRGSMTYMLIEQLRQVPITKIFGYDPHVRAEDIMRALVTPIEHPEQGIAESDVVIIMNNHQHFEQLPMHYYLSKVNRPVLLMDTWSLYPESEIGQLKHVQHYRL